MKNTFTWFKKIGIAEGISFLVLLLIAMPLKYFAGFPLAVTIAGSLHGILFIAFLILAWEIKNEPVVLKWKKNFAWLAICFLASILPLGTLVLDSRLKKNSNDNNFFTGFSNFSIHQRKRRYSCNLQIIHGNLRSVSPDRVTPFKYLLAPEVPGPFR